MSNRIAVEEVIGHFHGVATEDEILPDDRRPIAGGVSTLDFVRTNASVRVVITFTFGARAIEFAVPIKDWDHFVASAGLVMGVFTAGYDAGHRAWGDPPTFTLADYEQHREQAWAEFLAKARR
jgi:hypothetical protein